MIKLFRKHSCRWNLLSFWTIQFFRSISMFSGQMSRQSSRNNVRKILIDQLKFDFCVSCRGVRRSKAIFKENCQPLLTIFYHPIVPMIWYVIKFIERRTKSNGESMWPRWPRNGQCSRGKHQAFLHDRPSRLMSKSEVYPRRATEQHVRQCLRACSSSSILNQRERQRERDRERDRERGTSTEKRRRKREKRIYKHREKANVHISFLTLEEDHHIMCKSQKISVSDLKEMWTFSNSSKETVLIIRTDRFICWYQY